MSANIVKEKRYGRFVIGRQLLLDHPEEVMWLLSKCLIWRAEYSLERNGFEYWALCEAFPSMLLGMAAPVYDVVFEVELLRDGSYRSRPVGFQIGDQVVTWAR